MNGHKKQLSFEPSPEDVVGTLFFLALEILPASDLYKTTKEVCQCM